MATARRRRALPVQANLKRRRNRYIAAATSPAAKTLYAVVGTAGLAALAIAIFGPKRFQKEILKPAQGAINDQASQLWTDSKGLREQIGDQASQLWSDSKNLREQIAGLFERAKNQASREKLAQSFQSWMGHFRAT